MELLERYLVQIGRHLPKEDKQDTLNELRSLILENYDNQLDTDETEQQRIYRVIKEFGMPRDVAIQYRSDSPLLSRDIEPLVFLILKIIAITLPGALILARLIEYFQNTDSVTTMELLLNIAYYIPTIMTTVLSTLAFVYLLFLFIDRNLPLKFKTNKMEFEPNLLPAIPKGALKVSRFEAIFGIVGGVFFLYLFNYQPGLIAFTYNGIKEPLLNANFEQLLPLINVSVMISIGINIAFLYKGQKTHISASAEFFQALLSAITMILLATNDIFNETIIETHNLSFLPTVFKFGMIGGAIGTIIGAIVKFIKALVAIKE